MPYADEYERKLIFDFIHLQILRKAIEIDMRILSKTKLPRAYLKQSEIILLNISNDLREIKKEMYKRGIKVYEISREGNSVTYEALVRGYRQKFGFDSLLTRYSTEEYLARYMNIKL